MYLGRGYVTVTVVGSEIPNNHLECIKPCKSLRTSPYQLVFSPDFWLPSTVPERGTDLAQKVGESMGANSQIPKMMGLGKGDFLQKTWPILSIYVKFLGRYGLGLHVYSSLCGYWGNSYPDLRLRTMRVVIFDGDESHGIPIRKTNILVKVWKQLEGPPTWWFWFCRIFLLSPKKHGNVQAWPGTPIVPLNGT